MFEQFMRLNWRELLRASQSTAPYMNMKLWVFRTLVGPELFLNRIERLQPDRQNLAHENTIRIQSLFVKAEQTDNHLSDTQTLLPQDRSLAQMASIFGRFGNITFGGGSATIAVLHREIVVKRRWVSEETFGLCYALSRVTPGTNLLAFETGVGWTVRGWFGAIIALIAGSVPCSTLAVVVTFGYESFSQNVIVARAIRGALAATVGLMVVTAIQLLRPYLSKHHFIWPIGLALLSFSVVWKFRVPPVLDLGMAALLGFFLPARRSG